MLHPDNTAVGLLSLGMMAFALLIFLVVGWILSLNTYRFLPLRRSRTTYRIGMILLVLIGLPTLPFVGKAMRVLVVIASFGWNAYVDGLRIINKHGQLSDGSFLSVFWSAALDVGIVALPSFWVVTLAVWYMHFNYGRLLGQGVELAGVVRLDGNLLPRAQLVFYLVAGQGLRSYISVDTDEMGKYEVFGLLPHTYRVTVSGAEATVPSKYSDPKYTPLEFSGNQAGPVTWNLELESRP